jgi:hypothetical protein
MPPQSAKNKILSVKAYPGDAKTLLAFDIPIRKNATNLAGFTIACQPQGQAPFYLFNFLKFRVPADHAQVDTQPAAASINAPIHKFRWLHVPGSIQQGTRPVFGPYTYTVTPRYFDDNQSLLAIDTTLGVSVQIDVGPFQKGNLELGFTRGFTQSQAFDSHFGLKALIEPKKGDLLFDTGAVAGTNDSGAKFTFRDEYEWLGFTARERVFALLNEVAQNKDLKLDVFAYDLNEPDVLNTLIALGKEGRVRIILDDASLHHDKAGSKPEDQFEKRFVRAAGRDAIKRGHFGRYAHDKVLVVSSGSAPVKVLTGSTNFSVTGLYVNSNHVLVFNDPTVAAKYAEVFQSAWDGDVAKAAFAKSPLASTPFTIATARVPDTTITFSPHPPEVAQNVLQALADRITREGKTDGGSVLFAVMELDSGTGPVLDALKTIHANQDIFSYGITDSTKGIELYALGKKTGVLVTGKPAKSQLPPPFDQVRTISGVGHQVHHKFVVCGFNGDNPVVYCGSSNLALMGEQVNGDNLLAIRDGDVAVAFAIEALGLVDHFDFLDRAAATSGSANKKPAFASKEQVAESAGWFLSTTDKWVEPYYDPNDLHCVDRQLFA